METTTALQHGMKPLVYLADLRYNYSGVLANDCMPLGVAYMKAVMDRDLPEVECRLFAYPDRLLQALKDAPPARATVQVARLPKDVAVEVEVIALCN